MCVSGLVLGQVLGHRVPGGSSLMLISVALLLSTLAIHTGLMRLGVDLTWSVFFLCSTHSESGCTDTDTSIGSRYRVTLLVVVKYVRMSRQQYQL